MNSINRLTIYFLYDEDGVVDDYILYMLNYIKNYSSKLIIVINGEIKNEYITKLKKVSDKIVFRENKGLDAFAYKHVIEDIVGYDDIKLFDDVLLTNFTVFGPLFPLDDLFSKMQNKACDFWSLVAHPALNTKNTIEYHAQSYFVNYKKNLIISDDFKHYWQSMPEIKNYDDSVKLHELRQTPFFTQKGYSFDSYVPKDKYNYLAPVNSIIAVPERLLIEDKAPFIKRRIFYFDINNLKFTIDIDKIIYIMNYINNLTDYNTDLIKSNIIRTQNLLQFTQIKDIKHKKRKFLSRFHPIKLQRKRYRNKIIKKENFIKNVTDIFFIKENVYQYTTNRPDIWNLGKHSYAGINTVFNNKYSVVGAFCSIGNNCIIGHGEHPLDFLSTSPYFYFDELGFKDPTMPSHPEFWFLQPVIIGNDVWIGDDVFIKNGITIGDGAIIGASSVVTKDVPPYAIVVGNPAKVIRYRFNIDIIEKLLKLKWWNLSDEKIKKLKYENTSEIFINHNL